MALNEFFNSKTGRKVGIGLGVANVSMSVATLLASAWLLAVKPEKVDSSTFTGDACAVGMLLLSGSLISRLSKPLPKQNMT